MELTPLVAEALDVAAPCVQDVEKVKDEVVAALRLLECTQVGNSEEVILAVGNLLREVKTNLYLLMWIEEGRVSVGVNKDGEPTFAVKGK